MLGKLINVMYKHQVPSNRLNKWHEPNGMYITGLFFLIQAFNDLKRSLDKIGGKK